MYINVVRGHLSTFNEMFYLENIIFCGISGSYGGKYRYTISYPKFLKPKSSENQKFFHGGRLQPKYDGHHDNENEIDVPSSPGSLSKM
jgi:hypothetical protein